MRDAMNGALLDRKERKALAKARKKEAKAAAKTRTRSGARQAHLCAVLQGRHASERSQAPRRGDRRGPDRRAAGNRRNGDPDRKPGRHGDRLRPRCGRDSAPARPQDQSHRFGRSGGGERRLHDGLRGGPHRRRAVCDRRLDRRRGAGPEPPSAPEEERDRLRGDNGGRVQAHRLGAGRDHAGWAANISARSSTRPTARSRPMSPQCRPKVDIDARRQWRLLAGARRRSRSASSTRS